MSEKTTPTVPNGNDVEQMTEAGQQSMLAIAQLHSRLVRNALEVNAELVEFASRRIKEDIQTSERFTQCTSMNEAMELMNGFYQKAFEAYASEANKLVKIGTDAVKRTIEESQTASR